MQNQRGTMKTRAMRSMLVLCVLSASTFAPSQEPPRHDQARHLKLGLVLEGGGALGLAHIGVITWLEEHRIPVSYVTGTSMGGLVGGIYATGRSPAEVRELINGIDWDQVLSGVTPFQDLSFRRKQDAHEVPGQLEFGLRGGLQFPSGFNTGQGVNLVLDRVALPYSEIASFNDLPIPFACVATDLVTGTRWLDVRKKQDSGREFGPGPTAAWTAFRKVMPLQPDPSAPPPAPGAVGMTTIAFLKSNPAWNFFPLNEPDSEANVATAKPKKK